MKKTWIKFERELLKPDTRNKLGIRIWLYMYIRDRADWDTGKVYEWRDHDEAEDFEMPWRTLQTQRQQLEEDGFITCKAIWQAQEITIHNWRNPREYSGEVHNPTDGYAELRTATGGGSTDHPNNHPDTHPNRELGTPSIDSHITSQKSQGAPQATSLDVSGSNAVRIYSRITGQVYPPSGHIDTITEDLCNILDKYDSEQNAITDGKKHFTKWCSTRGKSGKTYGRTNPGWLQWWLEELAPAPGEHKTVEVPRPNALCGDAQRLLFMVEKQDRLDILPEYTDHIKGCFICGGATNAEVVKGQLAKLAERMGT